MSDVGTRPFDEAAERAVLAAMLTNDAALAAVPAMVCADDFYRRRERQLFATMAAMAAAGTPVDAVTVAARLPDQRDYLLALCEEPIVGGHASEYARAVAAAGARRRLVQSAEELARRAAASNGDLPGMLARFSEGATAAVERERAAAGSPLQTVAPTFLDWPSFFAADHADAEWEFPDVLARGRGHALYAGRKQKKSLFMLFLAVELATGRAPVVVVYLDFEMSEADIFGRLSDMGHTRDTDLSRLRYALLPATPPLDTPAGGRALATILDGVESEWPEHRLVVVLDTISRAVEGPENEADTYRAFFAHTGVELKRRHITWIRLDHTGKDSSRGQRGSSSKNDDVDIVWRLCATQNGIALHRDVARMPWVPEKVVFGMQEEPLRFLRLSCDWPERTDETAALLDRLEVPLEATVKDALCALRDAGEGRRTELVSAALRWRRERVEEHS